VTKLITCIFLLSFTVSDMQGQARTNTNASAPAKQGRSATFTEKLLKFFGISDSPSTLKGPGDEVTSGELWLGDLDSKGTRALASSAGYRSPVFLAGTKDVLAMRGNDVVQIPSGGGEGKTLYSLDDVIKLVGSGSKEPGKVLMLLRGEAGRHPRVALLTISTGAVTVVAYDPGSSQDLQMVEHLQGWSRTYGHKRVYVKRQAKQAFSGTVEWSDVFLQLGNQEPVDVSQCDGAQCGQPSLSEDGRLLVFVKAKAE
jgi:hypothetical protein